MFKKIGTKLTQRKKLSFIPAFLGLAFLFPNTLVKAIRKHLFSSTKKPELSKLTRAFLRKHFESDVRELSKLLNKDFTKWIR